MLHSSKRVLPLLPSISFPSLYSTFPFHCIFGTSNTIGLEYFQAKRKVSVGKSFIESCFFFFDKILNLLFVSLELDERDNLLKFSFKRFRSFFKVFFFDF